MFFLDFVEEEISDALQKDSDPTLADSGALDNTECKPDPLELFFSEGAPDNMLISNCKPFSLIGATPIPEEVTDFDQGVAMESDHNPRHGPFYTECEVSFDLPFSSPPPTALNLTPFDAPMNSPQYATSTTASYTPSHSTSILPSPMAATSTRRQNSELDLICSVLQSETTNQPITTYNTHSASQYNPTIPLDATTELLSLFNTPSVPEEPFNSFDSFPTSLMLNNQQFKPSNIMLPCSSVQLPSHGMTSISYANSTGERSPLYSESSYSEDSRQRSLTPTPSSQLAPSPVNSVCTEFSESDYGKDTSSVQSRLSESGNGESKKIISMPFYEFKKILDSPCVSERDKEQVKAIRKKGKNKVAAKHCRQRKLEIIMGLQQEVDKLKGFKTQLVMKSLSLQRRIEEDKRRVALQSQNFRLANVH